MTSFAESVVLEVVPAVKRIALWIDELDERFLDALRLEGVEVVAVFQAPHSSVPSFSIHDLFFGSRALSELPQVTAPVGWIDDSSFRLYARCAQRVGFYPGSRFAETSSGGIMLGSDVEDWARVHLDRSLQVLEGLKVDEVWFSFHPHLGVDNMLALAAIRTGRKCLVFTQIRFAPKFSWKQIGAVKVREQMPQPWKPWENGAVQPNLFYMRSERGYEWNRDLRRRIWSVVRRVATLDFSALSFRLYQSAQDRENWAMMSLLEHLDPRTRPWAPLRSASRRRFDINKTKRKRFHPAEGSGNYVYFPLHLEPEENVHVLGGAFTNQLDAVVAMHESLPPGWMLVLKENPIQTHLHRGVPFDERVATLPNVRFAFGAFSTHELIRQARLVATITGTAGYESLLAGKPCVYFGDAWYSDLPGATGYYEGIDLVALAETRVEPEELDDGLRKALTKLPDGLAHPRYAQIYADDEEISMLYREAARSMVVVSGLLAHEDVHLDADLRSGAGVGHVPYHAS